MLSPAQVLSRRHRGPTIIPRTVVHFIPSCNDSRRFWVYLFVGDETTALDEHLLCIQWSSDNWWETPRTSRHGLLTSFAKPQGIVSGMISRMQRSSSTSELPHWTLSSWKACKQGSGAKKRTGDYSKRGINFPKAQASACRAFWVILTRKSGHGRRRGSKSIYYVPTTITVNRQASVSASATRSLPWRGQCV